MITYRISAIFVALVLGAMAQCVSANERIIDHTPSASQAIDFDQQIRPIFTTHCTSCHGGVKQAADLSFVYADSAMYSVEPGDPENSELLVRVLEPEDEDRMPPPDHGPRLSDEEIDLLTRWVKQGAQWGSHWAYRIPKRHPVPDVSRPDWAREPIDAFVLEQLDRRGITPAGDEIPHRWLRRVSLDLIGLPPTIAERDAFLDDLQNNGTSAYAAVVDRLLQSPHFGERWASVWFDLVRYADSRGQGEDSPRVIWKYRDWVIDAFNQDLPYDQFTIKQLAGDLLPDRRIEDEIATAVHRLTNTNEEGGTDDEEFRIAAVLDRVSTTWQTWQGTTYGCAQCHDHPYDPFTHDEFYQFVGYFNNTVDCDLNDDWPRLSVPVSKDDYSNASRLRRDIDRWTRELWQREWDVAADPKKWTHLRISHGKTNKASKLEIEAHEEWDEYFTTGTVSSGTLVTVEMPIPDSVNSLTGIQITAMPHDPAQALIDSEWGFVMSNIKAELLLVGDDGSKQKPETKSLKLAKVYGDEPYPYHNPNASLNNERDGFSAYSRIHHPRQAVIVLDDAVDVPAGAKLRLMILHRVTELAAFPLVTRRAHFAVSSDEELTALPHDSDLVAAKKELQSAKDELAAIKSTEVPVLREREPSFTRPTHVFGGGLFLTKEKQVFPHVPQSLRDDDQPLSDRLEMAKWLVSDANPLTARVAVNRFWARMFGVGLVATEEDFGSTGDRPSHPELLDDLAVRFRDDYQWSVKRLLREIALSRTYRQSSEIRPELMEADASNRFLARGPRHGLPAETVRDQMLAISGLLSEKMFGEPAYPPLPPGVWRARRGSWKTPKPGEEDRYRRSVYTYVKRSVPFPISATFDAPSREFCVPKRLRSNTPLQPLMLMNDVGFVECSQALAMKMSEHCEDLVGQIEHGFSLATCRSAKPDEVQRLVDLHRTVEQASDASNAMQSVAAVLMNLDEVITK
ncbi:PSD1 and planctomycete cytochrome C domain-containing protein [Rhodopirellula sp. SWK7]|uniref:PSD1 and planctomycete cytochrome C domain-containing protein n=1 Tax=Rhodopirellula sp. SWK7 TaxID=595460 RepID=UPI0002BFF3AC|nr:PSD1 and planctomycete cytochrome C domain-containing protein [Rhodopirellula sp. SWK7]EMI44407.1 planctomycete cytochrome C domain protein [Rhodopirellula sp. SWK7]